MKDSVVICSRIESSRLPNKAFLKSGGISHIENLISRLSDFQVILAVPRGQNYFHLPEKYKNVTMYFGDAKDPLKRTYNAALINGCDNIVRLTHDKVLVDPELIHKALALHKEKGADYTYLTGKTKGIGFEIVTMDCLERAVGLGKQTEHLSYIFRNVSRKSIPYYMPVEYETDARLLIDYPEDHVFMQTLFGILGPKVPVKKAIAYLNENDITRINRMPEITIYSCVYNGSNYVRNCIKSMTEQIGFFSKELEIILIDDCSEDNSFERIVKNSIEYDNIRWFKNESNIGLAASSNIALKHAKGDYIIRLDVDDTFYDEFSINSLRNNIKDNDVIYGNFIRNGKEHPNKGHNHVGGALFRRSALNMLKFDDSLRGYEGYDLFKRAKDLLKITYYNEPVFYYTDRKDSMSNTNIEERKLLKRAIDEKYK